MRPAASFLAGGVVNYLGSMWPVFDNSSRRIAQFFYERLCTGEPIGEALRQARMDAYERDDPMWAAYVLDVLLDQVADRIDDIPPTALRRAAPRPPRSLRRTVSGRLPFLASDGPAYAGPHLEGEAGDQAAHPSERVAR